MASVRWNIIFNEQQARWLDDRAELLGVTAPEALRRVVDEARQAERERLHLGAIGDETKIATRPGRRRRRPG